MRHGVPPVPGNAMDSQKPQPKQCHRHRRRAVSVAFFFALVLLPCLLVCTWQKRIALTTRIVRGVLDRQGLADASYNLVRLSPGCVVLEDVRLGAPEAVLSIGRAEVRFTYPDVALGRLDSVRVRGVRTQVMAEGGRVISPLLERLKPLLAANAARGDTRPPDRVPAPARFTVGEVSVYDVQVAVKQTNGDDVATVCCDAGVLSEPDAHGAIPSKYRLWARLSDGGGAQGRFEGSLAPDMGAVSVSGDMKLASVEVLLARARRVAPLALSRMTAAPTNCSLTVRGSLALTSWTNAGPFEVAAELGRGSAFTFAQPEGLVRFQTFRLEASGTPQDAQCRLSAGIAGFRVGGQLQASQEEGRLLGVRGTARFRQTSTNRWVSASLDTDLPGRSVAQVLPRFLPLVSRLLSDGGTLHAEADLSQPPQSFWRGEVRYAAEARRSAVTLPAGRVGAGRVTIEGRLSIADAKPGELRTDVGIEEGYFVGNGLTVRGGWLLSLTAQPPYAVATGGFKGQLGEYAALPKSGVVVSNSTVRFEGDAAVTGLVTNPVWHVALRVPEFGIAGRPGNAVWQALAGGSAAVSYSATRMTLESDVWLRDAALAVTGSNAVKTVEAGVGRFAVNVRLPAFAPAAFSNATAQVTLGASNGWARAGGLVALENARMEVPFTWSPVGGLSFLPGQVLSWRRLDAQGVQVEPGGLELETDGKTIRAGVGVRVAGSRFGISARARVPLADPQQAEVTVTLPETELTSEDTLAALVKKADADAVVTGRVSADAQVTFLGTHPHTAGRIRLMDGRVVRGGIAVDGLGADVPFEIGLSFRTIDRPVVTFNAAKVGNVVLSKGRVEFQVTKRELFIDRAEVGWCKGSLNAYSVHLDPKHPKADVIVYADRIDLGEALMMVMPFKGAMEGVLYGRFPVGIDNGHVKLSAGFLYSLPGQGGKLRLEDNVSMLTLLEQAGITGDIQQPLSKALSDMDFSTLKMDLEPHADGEAVLRMKVDGKSNFKDWPAPVDLSLNLHGPLERLLNMGLDMSRKK